MLRSSLAVCLVSLCLAVFAGYSYGSVIVYGTQTDHPIVPGGSLDDVRMSVDLVVSAGKATFTFTNVSVSPEESAVMKLIVLDTYDDDTSTSILSNGVVLTSTSDVSYSIDLSPTLPGYDNILKDDDGMVGFEADSPPPTKGIGPAEMLQVQFDVDNLLSDSDGIDDYLAAFNGGGDTAVYSLGFHAISADTVDGESLSDVYAPEPAALSLLVLGGLALIRRRRK